MAAAAQQGWQNQGMSWKLALEYIRVFIWPFVTLTLGFVFRKQLSNLAGRLQTVETPMGTASFGRQADAVAQQAENIEDELVAEIEATGRDGESTSAPSEVGSLSEPTLEDARASEHELPSHDSTEEQSAGGRNASITGAGEEIDVTVYRRTKAYSKTFAVLRRLTESDPTGAVLSAWREVDREVEEANVQIGVKGLKISSLGIRRIASEWSIPPDVVQLADDLRTLRNRVVHEGDVVVTASDARSYVNAASRVIDAIEIAQSPQARTLRYREKVLGNLSRLTVGVKRLFIDFSIDALAQLEGGQQSAIIVKFCTRGTISLSAVQNAIERAGGTERGPGVLVITNASLSDTVREFNSRTQDRRRPIEVITWNGPSDNDLLVRALARVSRGH